MQVHFKTFSQRMNIGQLERYVLKKVSLIQIVTQNGVNYVQDHIQMNYLEYMVTQIIRLMNMHTMIDIRELFVHIYKVKLAEENFWILFLRVHLIFQRFPYYDLAFDLLKCCANARLPTNTGTNMLVECVVRMLGELRTKVSKEVTFNRMFRIRSVSY